MKKSNLFIRSALTLALAGTFGMANAATILPSASRDFALETCQTTTVHTLPTAIYTVGAGGGAIQDWYVTFSLTNGTFTATPTALVSTAGGTATLIAGGAGNSNVTFRINGSAAATVAADTVTMSASTVTPGTCSSPVTVGASNGLLYISGAVASPLEAVTPGVSPADQIASFTRAVTITMDETGTDPIDLNPTPASSSRLVFGPAGSLDGAVGTSPAETTTMLARQLAVVIGLQREPDNSAAFADVIDDLQISLQSGADTTSITSLCMDDIDDNACAAGESFNLTTGALTVTGGSWATNGGFLLINDATAFAPRTLTLDFALDVKVNAIRPGMTNHTYSYTAPTNNSWGIAYANGTLLRSAWFLYDADNNATMRLVNAGAGAAAVVDAKYYLDSGATGDIVGVVTIPALSGDNTPLNATAIPLLGTGTASRGYIEVVVAGDMANVDGQIISYATTSQDRTVVPMRNVTFDSGVRGMTPF